MPMLSQMPWKAGPSLLLGMPAGNCSHCEGLRGCQEDSCRAPVGVSRATALKIQRAWQGQTASRLGWARLPQQRQPSTARQQGEQDEPKRPG